MDSPAICDRCGFRYRRSQLRKEWTGLMVCADDFDPRPPQLDPPRLVPEGLAYPWSRPEPTPIELSDLDPVLPEDL